MNKLTHFMLPENTNRLYQKEARSSISLTKDVANKINDLVDAYNELSTKDLAWKQEQEGIIRGGIIYLKDNLQNSVDDMMTQLKENGFIESRVKENIQYLYDGTVALTNRLDNLLGGLKQGSTTMDAEIIDARVDISNQRHASIGQSIRSSQKSYLNYITSGDLNDVVTNMYAVVVNTTSNIPENTTGLLDVQLIYTTQKTNYYILQKWCGVTSGNVYFRSKFVNGSWNEWKKLNDSKSDVNFIQSGNLDTYFNGNLYAIVGASGVDNVPENVLGTLDVQYYRTANNNYWTMQTWKGITSGNEFYRTYRQGTWTDWFKINGSSENILNGKRIVFIGDSILGMVRNASGVVNQIQKNTGAVCYNFAFGGTRAKTRNGAWGSFDGESIAQAIASGDFSSQDTALPNMFDAPSYFANALTQLKAMNFNTIDYIVLNYGTNDWYSGNSTINDYKNAMENIIKTISTAYPHIIIIKCTATQRFILKGSAYQDGSEYTNTSNVNLKSIVDTDKDICDLFNIQLVNCYNIGINNVNKDHYFSDGDYTHHNENGRKRLADYISKNIY